MKGIRKLLVLGLSLMASSVHADESKDEGTPPKIAELKLMLGKWIHDSEGALAKMEVVMSKNLRFIERRIEIKLGGHQDMNIRQTIFWDPARKELRSIGFASDGGFEEGVWKLKGSTLRVDRKITYPDGKKGKATNTWEFLDKGFCYLTSSDRVIKGEREPDLVAMELERE